jgi:PAS domain S-box-containing protein
MDRLLLLVGATQLAMILQQRQAEESLRQSEERLRLALAAAEDATRVKGDVITTVSNELRWTAAIVEHSNDAIIGRTLDGIITSWNPGATQLYEYSAEEMIGRPIGTLAPPERLHDPSDILKEDHPRRHRSSLRHRARDEGGPPYRRIAHGVSDPRCQRRPDRGLGCFTRHQRSKTCRTDASRPARSRP